MKENIKAFDILRMSEEDAVECGRKYVYVATKRGGCGVIRDSLKLIGEKVHVGDSGKVLVKTQDGEQSNYPVYIYYDKDSGMWEGTTIKPDVDESMIFTDTELEPCILTATAILNPLALLLTAFL